MKLIEIINTRHKTVNLNRNIKSDQRSLEYDFDDISNKGQFSTAKELPDEHLIKLTQRRRINKDQIADAKHLYYREIVENSLWDNPHFPRIYESKEFIGKNNVKRSNWKVEKLIEIYKLNKYELVEMSDRYFYDSEADNFDNNFFGFLNCAYIFTKRKIHRIKYEPLIEAANILFKIQDKYKLDFDLHDGNIMFRRGSQGTQMVFVDPFFVYSAESNPHV